MGITKKMQDALNDQINAELFSAYLYLAMAAYFEDKNLGGFAKWMSAQAQEEVGHAMKIYSFVHERDGRVTLGAIEKPQAEWKSPLAAFEAAYKHEQFISASIDKLVDTADAEKDKATAAFLQWFVSEQVEEEDQTLDVVNKLTMIGDSPNALFMLDAHLGRRGQ